MGSGESAYSEAAPGVHFGRLLNEREASRLALETGLVGVLDLTSEFGEAHPFRELPFYRCVQVLDGTPPNDEQLEDAVDWIETTRREGPVYVHCALGHGRTGTVLVVSLIRAGLAEDQRDALMKLRAVRSGVGLNREQQTAVRRYLDRFESDRREERRIQ